MNYIYRATTAFFTISIVTAAYSAHAEADVTSHNEYEQLVARIEQQIGTISEKTKLWLHEQWKLLHEMYTDTSEGLEDISAFITNTTNDIPIHIEAEVQRELTLLKEHLASIKERSKTKVAQLLATTAVAARSVKTHGSNFARLCKRHLLQAERDFFGVFCNKIAIALQLSGAGLEQYCGERSELAQEKIDTLTEQ